MAHYYSDFDTVYARLRTNYAMAVADFWDANDAWLDAKAHWVAGDDHACLYDLLNCVSNIMGYDMWVWSYNFSSVDRSVTAEAIYWAHTDIPATEVNMASIIMSMYEATPSEFKDFIGIEDAYRQALWNMPFNRAYYAELARGFAQWE